MNIFQDFINFLIYDSPFFGTFFCGTVVGIAFGIYYISNRLNNQLPSGLKGFIATICFALSVACLVLLFPIELNLLLDGFFKGLLLALVGFGLSIAILLTPVLIFKKTKLKQNPILKKLVTQIKKEAPAHLIFCLDGIVILKSNTANSLQAAADLQCTSQQQLNGYSYLSHYTSYRKFCTSESANLVDAISFQQEGYPNMTTEEVALFIEVLNQQIKGYHYQKHTRFACYTDPAVSTTINSPYYAVNGHIAGGPHTSSNHPKQQTVLLDLYYVATNSSVRQSSAQPAPSKQNFPHQW